MMSTRPVAELGNTLKVEVNVNDLEFKSLLLKAYDLNNWLWEGIDGTETPPKLGTKTAMCCFDLVIEHHRAITTLIDLKMYGSATGLMRSVFETFVRGVWLNKCASPEEVEQYLEDNFRMEFWLLLKRVEELAGFSDKVLSAVKKNSWAALNSYTHGGGIALSRRINGDFIEPNYSIDELVEMLKFSGTFALLAFQQIMQSSGKLDLEQEAIQRLQWFPNKDSSQTGESPPA